LSAFVFLPFVFLRLVIDAWTRETAHERSAQKKIVARSVILDLDAANRNYAGVGTAAQFWEIARFEAILRAFRSKGSCA
jgi:hypothetical protein